MVRITEHELHLLDSAMVDASGLWLIPFESSCNRVRSTSVSVSKLLVEFPRIFAGILQLCKKANMKSGVSRAFWPKRPVTYTMNQAIDNELDRLKYAEDPVDFLEWAAPIVVDSSP